MQYNFEWDRAKAADNRRKHAVSFEQASELFADPLALTLFDHAHSSAIEVRWITLGCTRAGQHLVVVHSFEEQGNTATVRIISARPATRHERNAYEQRQ
ncbi:MAG: BrnT family toxin [Gammaproteobacteria bacterium]|nr:BrnT family toxin [Gammaproteobacteria bacterium]